MDLEFPLMLVISCSALLFTLFILISKRRKPTLNLPPGPPNLPFIGSLHLLGGPDPPHHTLRDLSNKYGPIMHLRLGEVGTVVVSSAATAKAFLKTHDLNFAYRPTLLAPEISCYGNSDIAFAPYGEYWRQLRRICSLELFSAKRVQSFRRVREEEALELCKWISRRAGSTVNLTEKLRTVSFDIMVRSALGKKTGDQAKLMSVIREGSMLIAVANIVDLYPSIKLLRLLNPMKWKIEKYHRYVDRIIESIIEERKRSSNQRGDDHLNDLLDVLLKVQDDGSLQIPLTRDNIKAVLVDMFGAGTDTPASTVDWAMAEMLKNPNVMKKAQDEVRGVFDSKSRHVDETYLDELMYLKLVVKETLRLHPGAPLLLPRESKERCEINGYEIPAKTRVLVNAWAMGRDAEYWEDAETFKPERFEEKMVDYKGSCLEYIPFGGGRRICPGAAFGIASVELQLAMLLYYFDWILGDGKKAEEVDMSETLGAAARRKHDLAVIPLVRREMPTKPYAKYFPR